LEGMDSEEFATRATGRLPSLPRVGGNGGQSLNERVRSLPKEHKGGAAMIFGMPPFTFIHTLISLVGIATGLVVLFAGLLVGKHLPRWTARFLASTVLTSVTGFMLPAAGFMPAHGVGILSLLVLAVSLFALYSKHLAGAWRRTYVITAVIALYLNVFVLVAQLFAKVPALKALAPTQNDPPFKVAQLLVLVAFIILGALAAVRFRPTLPGIAAPAS
jgi:hypothetical protein